ncbi:MAG: formylglycine-generating enzyme family protein [Cytophagales bacterium]|nr:formylglycine-generating enzyme family protein [Cytophagales bacterium]
MTKILPFLTILFLSCGQVTTSQNEVGNDPCYQLTDSLANITEGLKKMVLIPSGKFLMGDSSGTAFEQPVHQVNINGFYMDETPVTYADFQKYVDDGGAVTRYWAYSSYNIPEQPISGISWYHAVNYCNWRSTKEGFSPCYTVTGNYDKWGLSEWELDPSANGYRLPTEAQWEYAARGGLEQNDFPWGNDFEDSWANYDTDRGRTKGNWWRLAPVKSQRKNAYGLYGMAGNVWEWCDDWYTASIYKNDENCNPKGPSKGSAKVVRGGGWGSPSPEYLKVFKRSYAAPSNYNYSIGFRCVRAAFSRPDFLTPLAGFNFYQYPKEPVNTADISSIDFYSDDFTRKLGLYLKDNFPQSLYFIEDVDGQVKISPEELAQLIVEESQKAKINPLFVTSIMISESGFATVSFPRWWNNPMAYHWQNKLMPKGLPSYTADKTRNRKYKDLRAAIQNYSRIRRSIYFERAENDLYSFHLLYVGYEAEEWMYTVGKVFREVVNVEISPRNPSTHVGRFIYSDWKVDD